MAQLFDDEILSVVLQFRNPNRRDMEDADKLASKLSLALDNVIRKSISAGKSVGDVVDGIKRLEPTIKTLEKRAGTIGATASALQTAQRILARYTPARLEKMAEVQASKIAETSGTAALRREMEKNGELMKRLIATNEGRYDRATRGSPIGRGMFIDTETTGLNALKHQITELTATLFTFSKKTGEILDYAERTYHGFQQLDFQSRKQFIPTGVGVDQLRSQAISATVLRRMLQQADFVVAHNAQHDKKFAEKVVPEFASAMWLDSMRGIPWRTLGFRSRAQQDLLRAHGISPGVAHRSSDDVASAIKLLGSRSMLGGPTYLSTLLGNQGPLNQSQQIMALLKSSAEEIKSSLQTRLGAGEKGFPPSANYRAIVKNYASVAADGVSEIFSQYVIAAIEGKLHGLEPGRVMGGPRRIGRGAALSSGEQSGEGPGSSYYSSNAISLDRRIGVVDEFLRNLTIMSGPASSSAFMQAYEGQSKFQEKIQQSRGRGVMRKDEIRSGDQLSLAAMQGMNTMYSNRRLGIPPGGFDDFLQDIEKKTLQGHEAFASRMLTQPWAKPERAFTNEEIGEFIAKYQGKGSVESIRTAAQMASHVGPHDSRFSTLASILSSGQQEGRQLATIRAANAQRDALDKLAGGVGSGRKSGFRNVIGEALRGLSDAGLATAMTTFSPFMSAGGLGGGSFGSFFNFFRRRRQAQQGRPLSYDERAEMPLGEPATLRGSMRRDALEQKLRKLQDAIEATTRSFQSYRDVVAKGRADEAARRYYSRDASILSGQRGTGLSLDAQLSRLDFRRQSLRNTSARRLSNIQSGFEERSSSLGFSQLEAEMRYEDAIAAQKRTAQRLRQSKSYGKSLTDQDIDQILSAKMRPAQMKLIRAEYEANASQLTSPTEIDALRQQTAARLAAARYGAGGGDATAKLREEYKERVSGLLGGQTLAQKAEARSGQVAQDQITKEKELDSQVQQVQTRRQMAEEKASAQRQDNASRYASAITKVEDDVEKRRLAGIKKVSDAEKKMHEAKVKYLKQEDASGGGGGGGSRGGSGGAGGRGGGRDDFASREGFLTFGLGLSTLAGYGAALWSGIKEAAIYSAQVDTLKFSTQEIAKVNSLDVQQVMQSVEQVRQLNMTTQAANNVVQRMIFAQLDAGKAKQVAQVAQNISVISGQTPSESLERIITGVSTGLTISLHRMGLPVSMVQVNRQLNAERRAEGKEGPPSEVEKRQALLNAVIREGAKANGLYEKSLMTAGGQLKQFEQTMQELQYSVGKEFLPEFGRFMSLMAKGAKFVDDNAASVAKLASVLAGLAAAAGTIGTLSVFRYLFTRAPIPWWAKLIGAGVGLGVTKALNMDDAQALNQTAAEQKQALAEKMKVLLDERKRLESQHENTPEWKNAMDANTDSLRAAVDTQEAINVELTQKLAEQYTKRLTDLDDYIDAMEGKHGALAQFLATQKGSPENSTIGNILRDLPLLGQSGSEDLDEARKQRETLADTITAGGVNRKDLLAEVERQKQLKEHVSTTPFSILNKEKLAVESLFSEMTEAEDKLNKLDEKFSEEGTVGLKARKSMGTPRQKVLLDYEEQVAQVNRLGNSLAELQKKAKVGDVGAKLQLSDLAKRVGGGSIEAGNETIQGFLDRKNAIVAEAAENRNIDLGKINAQNQAAVVQAKQQVEIAKIEANVVQGNYEAEKQAILDVFSVKKQTAEKTKVLLQDIDGYQKQLAQDETERDAALIALEAARKRAEQARSERIVGHGADLEAEDILQAPGTNPEQAIKDAFEKRLSAAKEIKDDQRRADEVLSLLFERDEAIRRLARESRSLSTEDRISAFQSNQQLSSEVDRVISSQANKRQSSTHRALAEIERTRQGEVGSANFTFNERSKIAPASELQGLQNQRNEAIRGANVKAMVDSIKTVEQEIDTARERLAKSYSREVGDVAEIMQGLATSQNEEVAAANNIHKLRLKYIEEEYKARGETLEAEQTKQEETQQAEMDHLKGMLDLRKQQIDEIRSFAEQLFQTLSTDHGRGLRDMMLSEARGIGAKIFGNLAVEYTKDVHLNMPGLKDASGNPTRLGRILSGTVLGRQVPTDKEIQDQIEKVTEGNTEATKENTTALDELTKLLNTLIEEAKQGASASGSGSGVGTAGSAGAPGAAGAVGTSGVPGASGGLFNIPRYVGLGAGPLFSGASSSNPFVFNMSQGGINIPSVSPLSGLLPGVGGGAGAPPGAVSTSLNFGDGSIDLGTATYGAGSMPMSVPTIGADGGVAPTPPFVEPSMPDMVNGPGQPRAGAATPIVPRQSPLAGIPGLGGAISGASQMKGAGKYIGGAATTLAGAYQAFTNFGKGKGARGIAFGIGGALTSAAGIAAMIPGGQVVAPFLELGALGADLIGSFFQDPKQKRNNQIANYLAANAYMSPAALDLTTTLAGNLAAEGKGGTATDSGIKANTIKVTAPTMEVINPSPAFSFTGKPSVLGTLYPNSQSTIPADNYSGQQLLYSQIPGQVSYADLPGESAPPGMTINIHALDAQSILNRSGDIAAAVQKELQLGTGLSQSLQNSIFGAG